MEGGVHFLTRLNAQASYQVTTSSRKLPEGQREHHHARPPRGDVVLSDETIIWAAPTTAAVPSLKG